MERDRDPAGSGGSVVAGAAAVRVGCTSQKRVGLESVVYRKMRHVLAHRVSERANHSRRGPRGRLEEKRCPVDAIDHPRMLAIDLWPIVIDHAAHAELGVDADLCQLAPRPQRKVLAVSSLQFLEDPGMLPNVPLVKQLKVGDVLAGLQPRDDLIDRPHAHAALALEVVSERLMRARPEHARWHRHHHALPRRFTSDKTRGKTHERCKNLPERPSEWYRLHARILTQIPAS